jgi:hypothetical protein
MYNSHRLVGWYRRHQTGSDHEVIFQHFKSLDFKSTNPLLFFFSTPGGANKLKSGLCGTSELHWLAGIESTSRFKESNHSDE